MTTPLRDRIGIALANLALRITRPATRRTIRDLIRVGMTTTDYVRSVEDDSVDRRQALAAEAVGNGASKPRPNCYPMRHDDELAVAGNGGVLSAEQVVNDGREDGVVKHRNGLTESGDLNEGRLEPGLGARANGLGSQVGHDDSSSSTGGTDEASAPAASASVDSAGASGGAR